VRGVSPELAEAARRLRQEATPAERVLWQGLRGGRLAGLKFRRQHAVGPFVLDFFCPKHKLVVEVDGAVHNTPDQRERDAGRDERLQLAGCRVLRLRNAEVLGDLDAVVEKIAAAVGLTPASRPSPLSPLPILGEGDSGRLFEAEGEAAAEARSAPRVRRSRRVALPSPADAPRPTSQRDRRGTSGASMAAKPPDAPKAPSSRSANPMPSGSPTPGSPLLLPGLGEGGEGGG